MARTGDPVRDEGSHIRGDGTAKRSYNSEEEAARDANDMWARTGRPYNHYLCSQKPDHWHVGKGVADIRRVR